MNNGKINFIVKVYKLERWIETNIQKAVRKNKNDLLIYLRQFGSRYKNIFYLFVKFKK